jgi:hypothetical protein
VTDPTVQHQLVSNSGMIRAHGGTVILSAAAAKSVVDSLVNNTGIIEATAIAQRGGEIILYAEGSNAVANNITANKGKKSGRSLVTNSGILDASGRGTGQVGGTIEVLGDQVALLTGNRIDVSGDSGGGTVHIGGDFHGAGITPTALQTYVDVNASILADATTHGNGGQVAVWSDNATGFYGSITARGGAQAGDGGFVETSGHNILDFQGLVDTTAVHGFTGTLLLDPNDITISVAADTGTMVWTGTQFNDVTAAASNWSVATLQARLATNNVLITTNPGAGGTGNITVSNAVTWSAANTLTLFANNDINVNASITYTGVGNTSLTFQANNNINVSAALQATSTGKMDIILNSDRDASSVGQITINVGSSVLSNGGDIVLGGGATPLTVAAYGIIPYNTNSGILMFGTLNSGAGNITLNGNGGAATVQNYSDGITIAGTIQTTTGNITIKGTGAGLAATAGNAGVNISNSAISTQSGTIAITGIGGTGGGTANDGVDISANTTIQSMGSGIVGAINITGTGGPGGAGNYGISTNNTNMFITSVDANINLTGTATATSIGVDLYGTLPTLRLESTGNGSITLNGTGNGGSPDIRNVASTNIVRVNNGNLNILANLISITAMGTFQSTNGDVIIRPRTAGTTVGIGTGAGALSITDVLLNGITYGGTLWLGGDSGWNQAGNTTITNSTYNYNGNVNILSGNDILATAGTMTKNGGSSGTTLNFMAKDSIIFSGGASINSTSGTLNAILNANSSASGAGAVWVGDGATLSSITSNGGNITLGGGTNPLTTSAFGTAANTRGIKINKAILTSAAGNISMLGTGFTVAAANNYGIALVGGSTVQSTSGTITLNGIGGAGTTTNFGVSLNATADLITSQDGNISITGTGGAGTTGTNIGIYVNGNISATGNGIIMLLGTGGSGLTAGVGSNAGVQLSGAGNGVTSKNGNISITGSGGTGAGTLNAGVAIQSGSQLASIGTATITINSTGNGTGGSGYGTIIDSATVNAVTGNITIIGTGAGVGAADYGIQLSNSGIVSSTGTATITLTGIGGNGATDIFTTAGANKLGGASDTGNITLIANSLSLTNFTAQTTTSTGNVFIRPRTVGTTVGVGAGTGTLSVNDATLSLFTYGGTLTIGGDSAGTITAGNMDINTALPYANPARFLSNGDIILNHTLSSSATGTDLVLAAGGNFINNAGAAALNPNTGRYLVYSTNPALNTLGGLVDTTHRYNRTFAGYAPSAVTETGNVFLYSIAPTLSVTANNATRIYGATNPSFTASYSGFIDGDTAATAITGAPVFTTAPITSGVGNYNITGALGSLASILGNSRSLNDACIIH